VSSAACCSRCPRGASACSGAILISSTGGLGNTAPLPQTAYRLCTIAGCYRYAVEEELLDHYPAARVRRPRIDHESHATALDRNELGALLVAAGLGRANEHALISLLALNGLRVPEATSADIEALGTERGHRTLVITRKGGKVEKSRWHPAPPGRLTWPSVNAAKDRSSSPPTGDGWTGMALGGSSAG
jgi:integrase